MPVLSSMEWGTHICHFYETDQDHVETVSSCIEAGLAAGQHCLWVTSGQLDAKRTAAELLRLRPGFADPLRAGAVRIVDAEAWYLDGSRFDPAAVVRGWESKAEWQVMEVAGAVGECKHVVEVVRYSARKAAERFHFLRL